MTVEYVGKGGSGNEAVIDVEIRDEFPGMGKIIGIKQSIQTAHRKPIVYSEEKVLHEFLRHTVAKKLEDYFFMTGRYKTAHIPRPMGITDQGYLYEWVPGKSGFQWAIEEKEERIISLVPADWDNFSQLFRDAGIDMSYETGYSENLLGCSDNIVHKFYDGRGRFATQKLKYWKRIDFGLDSLVMDYEKIHDYVMQRQDEMVDAITLGRFWLLKYAIEFLIEGNEMDPEKMGELEEGIFDFRLSTLDHLDARGIGIEHERCEMFASKHDS
ncbi:hypothetical protein ACFL1B_05050 [Nanoarchaeota archaeon]